MVPNMSCGEENMAGSTVSSGRKHEEIQVTSQDKRTQTSEILAVQPERALLNQKSHNFETGSMKCTPDARDPPSPRVIGREIAIQSTPIPRRVYRRRFKSDCLTCRQKKFGAIGINQHVCAFHLRSLFSHGISLTEYSR